MVGRHLFPIIPIQACLNNCSGVNLSCVAAGEWHGVLELVVIALIKRSSTQNATRYMRFELPVFEDHKDPTVVGNSNR